jgi:hypothetical protein
MAHPEVDVAALTMLETPLPSVPLRGYVLQEDEGTLWIRDMEGIWLVRSEDIVAKTEWPGGDPRFHGDPKCVFIRKGADIYAMTRFKVLPDGLPLTFSRLADISSDSSPTDASEVEISASTRQLGFPPEDGAFAGNFEPIMGLRPERATKSRYVDPTWGPVAFWDDCGYF